MSGKLALPAAVVGALVHGASYRARAVAVSRAGLAAEVWSADVAVDATPPAAALSSSLLRRF